MIESPIEKALGLIESPIEKALGLIESPIEKALGLIESPVAKALGSIESPVAKAKDAFQQIEEDRMMMFDNQQAKLEEDKQFFQKIIDKQSIS